MDFVPVSLWQWHYSRDAIVCIRLPALAIERFMAFNSNAINAESGSDFQPSQLGQ